MPAMESAIERRMQHWSCQRWLLDVVVQTVGIEWDQRRIGYTLGPCGPDFNVASPTFKLRFMYMAGYEDEDEFDRFAETLTLEGVGEKVTCPYLVLAGEDDHLSPTEYTYQLMDTVKAPKQLVLYEGADHDLGGSSSADLGPNPATLAADWLKDRLDGKPMESQHILIDLAGQTQVGSFADYARMVWRIQTWMGRIYRILLTAGQDYCV